MSRNIPIPFKVNLSEEKFLEDQSKKMGMNRSEYIRYKLFEENFSGSPESRENFKDKTQADVIKFSVYTFNLLIKIAEKIPDMERNEMKESIDKSKKWLLENGYLDEIKEN